VPLREERDGRVLLLTFNRPEKLNALSIELIRSFVRALDEANSDDTIGAVVITGEGDRAFTAGMDLKEAAQGGENLNTPEANIGLAISRFRKPIIVAVNGLCITGGLELILACDVVLAATTAQFADTHVRVGLLPGWGISQRLARQIGPQRAKEISLTGNFVDARRAFEYGLVNRLVEPAELLAEALGLAHDMADGDSAVVQAYKQVIDDGYLMTLGDALPMERQRGSEFFASLPRGAVEAGRLSASARNRADLG
jgi:enoyl-CoA hydratase